MVYKFVGKLKSAAKRVQEKLVVDDATRHITGLVAIFVIFGIVFSLAAGAIMRDNISDLVEEKTDAAARKADSFFLKYTTISENSQNTYVFKDYLDSISSRDDALSSEYYNDVLRILDTTKQTSGENLELVWLADINNSFIVYAGGAITPAEWEVTTRPWYYNVVVGQRGYLTDPFPSTSTNNMIISVVNPILSADGKQVIGAFGMGLSHRKMAEALKVGDNGNTILLSDFGQIIYHFDEKYLYKQSSDCNYSENLLEEFKKPSGKYLRFEENGKSYIGKVQKLENCDFTILTQLPTGEIYDGLTGKVGAVAIGGAAILAGIVAMYMYFFYLRNKHKRTLQNIKSVDELTGLDNFERLAKSMEELLARSPEKNYVYISFNIKKYEVISEVIGLDDVRELLKHIASVMQASISAGELAGRVSTSEFAFILEFTDEKSTTSRLKGIVEHFISFPPLIEREIHINFAFGAYVVDDISLNLEVISRRAGAAKKMSVSVFKSEFLFYNKDIEDKELYEQSLEDDMERALETDEFKVYLQGKYDVNTDCLKGAEALVRWKHGKRGIISPNDFIPLFEDNHFITRMDFYVYHKVGQIMSDWIMQGIVPVPVSVNMSRLHFSNSDIVNDFVAVIDKYNIPHRLIEVEITETALIGDEKVLVRLVEKFHNAGIHVSIDDFGAGYSSLGLLKNLEVDTLKLDKNFFDNIENSVKDQNLVKNMIKLAADLDVDTVSEGIETRGQRDFLKKYGGQLIQGYYYSRPIPYAEFTEMLK